jgi:glycosyltransferase involved in cell wall biosynthesis
VGLPVYKGAELVAKALDCLQRQTFGNFEAIISVDGNDTQTALACRPFLADPRFRMVIHPKRLDFVGNFNWLLQQNLQEFFCYRQHDDTTAPEFFEVLLQAADRDSNAATVYADCRFSGGRNDLDVAPSIEGPSLQRMLQYIESQKSAAPLRGLIRRAAIRQAGVMRSDEFRAPLEDFVWLAKLLRWGNFRRVPEPLYYKLDHPRSFTNQYLTLTRDRKRAVWTTLFTGLLEAAIPLCRTPQERLFFQQFILGRIVLDYLNWPNTEPSSEKIISECLERLRYEGNTHLLRAEEQALILQQLQRRLDKAKQSRMRGVIYRIRLRYLFGRLIYPRSRVRRAIYQIRQLVAMLTDKMSRLFAF